MKIENSQIAVSSRIRLARNFDGINFPSIIRNTDEERRILAFTVDLFIKIGGYEVIPINGLSKIEVESLTERYLISGNLSSSRYGAVILNADKSVSVMVNEEDHVREQCILSGLDLKGAYRKLSAVDALLSRTFRFAKSGSAFLTSCPSNVGSGMRASVMVFLPALTNTSRINEIIEMALSRGLTVRGAFGEGSDTEGYLYQISNRTTLDGVSAIIERVERFVTEVERIETDQRYDIFNADRNEFEDKCMRSLGILKSCRLLSYPECAELISSVKLGFYLGFIYLRNPTALDDLMVTVRPSTLKLVTGDDNDLIARADYVKNALKLIE